MAWYVTHVAKQDQLVSGLWRPQVRQWKLSSLPSV